MYTEAKVSKSTKRKWIIMLFITLIITHNSHILFKSHIANANFQNLIDCSIYQILLVYTDEDHNVSDFEGLQSSNQPGSIISRPQK